MIARGSICMSRLILSLGVVLALRAAERLPIPLHRSISHREDLLALRKIDELR